RLASRRMWGQLLEAGVQIYEYRATMMHAKVLVVDGVWSGIGTPNLENRWFEQNDEDNMALLDRDVARRLLEDYQRDIDDSDEVTLEAWRRRRRGEKIVGPFIWILEAQQ